MHFAFGMFTQIGWEQARAGSLLIRLPSVSTGTWGGGELAPDGARGQFPKANGSPLTPAPDEVLYSGCQPRGLKTALGMLPCLQGFLSFSTSFSCFFSSPFSVSFVSLFLQGLPIAQAQGRLLMAVSGTPPGFPSPQVLLYLQHPQ